MKLWRHGIITYLRLALEAGILKSDLKSWELLELLADKYEVGWHVDMQERISKRHFLGYAARYIRRPPIAQHRFQEIRPVVKFWTKDTATKETVLDELPKEQFSRFLRITYRISTCIPSATTACWHRALAAALLRSCLSCWAKNGAHAHADCLGKR